SPRQRGVGDGARLLDEPPLHGRLRRGLRVRSRRLRTPLVAHSAHLLAHRHPRAFGNGTADLRNQFPLPGRQLVPKPPARARPRLPRRDEVRRGGVVTAALRDLEPLPWERDLERLALSVREHVIRMASVGGCFLGASLSCTDLLVYLYKRVLRISKD